MNIEEEIARGYEEVMACTKVDNANNMFY